jgi:hypothetical protein
MIEFATDKIKRAAEVGRSPRRNSTHPARQIMDDAGCQPNASGSLLCPECGGPSGCQRDLGCAGCWCMKYPKVLPTPANPNAACLCEACLRERLASLGAEVPRIG